MNFIAVRIQIFGVLGMRTYFIAGRVQDVDSATNKTTSYSDSIRDAVSSDTQMSRSQMSFRKVTTIFCLLLPFLRMRFFNKSSNGILLRWLNKLVF